MKLQDFDYVLPQELIAQKPADKRDSSRLLTVSRSDGDICESSFAAVGDLLSPGDLLVLNDTRVIPARLHGKKETGGNVEVFLVRRIRTEGEVWQCLLRCSKKPRPGTNILLPMNVTGRVLEDDGEGHWSISFLPAAGFEEWLERVGSMPLPPYIRRSAESGDSERYQTVFARVNGAVAAPTAGLHFTPELLRSLRSRGIETACLTLHVGLGTFLPVRVENPGDHRMHSEYFSIPHETAVAVNSRKSGGGRVIAVGTTVTRALEHAAGDDGKISAGEGETDIFIYPGHEFRVVQGLITNFHLPCSTLLMLVSAFAGRELVLRAYEEAVQKRFRFFSYGDAMFIS